MFLSYGGSVQFGRVLGFWLGFLRPCHQALECLYRAFLAHLSLFLVLLLGFSVRSEVNSPRADRRALSLGAGIIIVVIADLLAEVLAVLQTEYRPRGDRPTSLGQ